MQQIFGFIDNIYKWKEFLFPGTQNVEVEMGFSIGGLIGGIVSSVLQKVLEPFTGQLDAIINGLIDGFGGKTSSTPPPAEPMPAPSQAVPSASSGGSGMSGLSMPCMPEIPDTSKMTEQEAKKEWSKYDQAMMKYQEEMQRYNRIIDAQSKAQQVRHETSKAITQNFRV